MQHETVMNTLCFDNRTNVTIMRVRSLMNAKKVHVPGSRIENKLSETMKHIVNIYIGERLGYAVNC